MMPSTALQVNSGLNWNILLNFQAWVLILVFLGFIGVFVWRRIGPGFPGIARGTHQITTLYSGRYFEELTGNLVEFTDFLLGPEYQRAFLDYASKALPGLTKFATTRVSSNPTAASASTNPGPAATRGKGSRAPNPGTPTQSAAAQVQASRTTTMLARYPTDDLKSFTDHGFTLTNFGSLRMILNGVRTSTGRHVLLTFVSNERSFPEDYVAVNQKPGFNILNLDFMNKGRLTGYDYELPERWDVPRIGKCKVHIYFPIAIDQQTMSPIPTNLGELKQVAKLSMFARFTWEVQTAFNEKDKVIDEKETEIRRLRGENSALATMVDAAHAGVAAFSTETGKPLTAGPVQSQRQIDAFIYVLAAVIGGFGGQYLAIQPVIGSTVAVMLAAIGLFIARR
jgi:hypothetical protein